MSTCNFTGIKSAIKVQLECTTCQKAFFEVTEQLCSEDQAYIKRLIEEHRSGKITLKTLTKSKNRNAKPTSIINKSNSRVAFLKGSSSSMVKNLTEMTFSQHLKRHIKNYKHRPMQVKLATTISDTLVGKQILIAEAGVGTGKSLAYLIPIMHYSRSPIYKTYNSKKKPIVISTKTIALQEQLIKKDIPAISALFPGVEGFLAKGKSHYLCTKRYNDALYNEKLKVLSEDELLELSCWVATTTTGDRNEAPELPDKVWELININNCNPYDCNDRNTCGALIQKNIRNNFDNIIVANHNLLIDDLLLRKKTGTGLWPEPSVIIVDEAHNLEDSARSELSQEISTKQIFNIIREIKKINIMSQYINGQTYEALDQTTNDFLIIVKLLIEQREPDENNRVYIPNTSELLEAGKILLNKIEKLYQRVNLAYGAVNMSNRKLEYQINRQIQNIENIMNKIRDWITKPSDYYLAGEQKGNHVTLTLGPISVANFLRKNMWNNNIPIVLTSGTLTTDGSFNHVKKSLGLDNIKRVNEFKGQSTSLVNPNNVALYIAADMPKPRPDDDEDIYAKATADRIAELVKCSGGRALVLFTSHRRLNNAYELLKSRPDIPWRVLHQRNRDAAKLFREDRSSILMATGAYWEGIDVIGDALTLVIMDKLPFPSPEEALTRAKELKLIELGIDPHRNLYIPEMVLKLKQGAGRLLRHENDWGAIAILDPRAANRYYDLVKGALPPHVEIRSTGDLKKWYKKQLEIA
jgi:ATP-dependent DNA helicase DinG